MLYFSLQCLNKLFQIRYCVTGNTDVGAGFGDDRPLNDAQFHKLTGNVVQLLEGIDASNMFIDRVADVGCITWLQREHLIHTVQPYDRNVRLLEMLTRRSVANYKKFTHVLSKEQPHLVPLLVTDEGVKNTFTVERHCLLWFHCMRLCVSRL